MLRFLVKALAAVIVAALVAGAVYVGFVILALREIFGALTPGPAPWSDAAEVPAAFAGAVPAAAILARPDCPDGGFNPVRGPNPTGQMVVMMLMPWYAIPALLQRDDLLGKPVGTVTVTITDPYLAAAPAGVWVAALRLDTGRFVEQVTAGSAMTLPEGRYRLRAAVSTSPLRWGEREVTVAGGASVETSIALDRVAPTIEPVALAGAAPAAGKVALVWRGADAPDGLAVMARVGARGGKAAYRTAHGADQRIDLDVSGTPGQNVASYLLCAPIVRMGRWLVDVGASDAAIEFPTKVRGGEPLALKLRGSFASVAQYAVTETEGDRRVFASGFASAGQTIALEAPLAGGTFDVTLDADDGAPLAKARLVVDPEPITIVAPASMVFRDKVELGWRTGSKAKLELQILPYTAAGWPAFAAADGSKSAGPASKQWKIPPGKVAVRIVQQDHTSFGVAETTMLVTGGPEFINPPTRIKAGARLDFAVSIAAAAGDRVAIVPHQYSSLQNAIVVALPVGARSGSLTVPDSPGEFDLIYATAEGVGSFDEVVASGRVTLQVE